MRFYFCCFLFINLFVYADEINPLLEKKIKKIEIIGLKDEQLDNAYKFLQLESIKNELISEKISENEEIINPDYAYFLLKNGINDIRKSQQVFGYYNPKISWQIKDDKSENLEVIYQVELGKPVLIKDINLNLSGEALQDVNFANLIKDNPLQLEDKFNHRDYELYKNKFSNLASERGYFDQEFLENQVLVDTEKNTAEVNLSFDSGQRYKFGKVNFKIDKDELDNSLLERFILFNESDYFLEDEINTLQNDLQNSNYFSEVIISGEPDRNQKIIPINAQLKMNKNKHYLYGIGYSTDTGIRGKFAFDRRWVNRKGHQLDFAVNVSMRQSGFSANYKIPGRFPSSDAYLLRAGGEIKNNHYKNKYLFLEGGYEYKRNKLLSRYFLGGRHDNFKTSLDNEKANLLYTKTQWVYNDYESIINPKNGWQARLELMGASKLLLSDINLLQANFDLRHIYTYNDKHRFINKLSLGANWTNNFNRLAPSLRYFTGGDKSIRGYAFENIGERDIANNNIGGKYKYVLSSEYEYYFTDTLAAAVFIDAGSAYLKDKKIKVGAGLGVHWSSPVGQIKLDLGHGFNKTYGDNFRIHLSIGTDFDL